MEEPHWNVQSYGGEGSFGRERMLRALAKACLTLVSIQKKMMVEERGGRSHHSEGQGKKPVLNLMAGHRDCTREEFCKGPHIILGWICFPGSGWSLIRVLDLHPLDNPSYSWCDLFLYTFRSWSWLIIICVVNTDICFTFCHNICPLMK